AAVVEIGSAHCTPVVIDQDELRVHHAPGVLINLDSGGQQVGPVVAGRVLGDPLVGLRLAQEADVHPQVGGQADGSEDAGVGYAVGRSDPQTLARAGD